jgi:hypothetical protein
MVRFFSEEGGGRRGAEEGGGEGRRKGKRESIIITSARNLAWSSYTEDSEELFGSSMVRLFSEEGGGRRGAEEGGGEGWGRREGEAEGEESITSARNSAWSSYTEDSEELLGSSMVLFSR